MIRRHYGNAMNECRHPSESGKLSFIPAANHEFNAATYSPRAIQVNGWPAAAA